MPIYVYRCGEDHETEAVRPRECDLITCACGLPARRAFCSGIPAIRGETVPKGMGAASAISKHGYMDLDLALEAMDDVQRDARKRGIEPPDLFAEAKRRVASGEPIKRRLARGMAAETATAEPPENAMMPRATRRKARG